MYGHSGGMFFGGGLMWIVWLILLVVLIYVLKDIFGSANKRSSSDEALEILKQRFARGEIDEAEFERSKKLLQ
jgi:putative membrane protein